MFKRCLSFTALLFLFFAGFSQNAVDYALSADKAKELYHQQFSDPNGFLYGKEYILYHYGLETSPLFNASLGMEGKVYSNGESYPAMLAYDIYKDELILLTEAFPEYNFIALNSTAVDSFSLQVQPSSKSPLKLNREKEYHFLKIDLPDSLNIKDGYYEVAGKDSLKIFVHHEAIQGNNEGEEAVIHGIFRYDYIQKKTLSLDGTYYELDSKRKFVNLFPEHKKIVNKKLRSFSTRFEDLSARQLLETVQLAVDN